MQASLVSFAAITLCVASQWVIPKVSVHFIINSVWKLLDTPSYFLTTYCSVTGNRDMAGNMVMGTTQTSGQKKASFCHIHLTWLYVHFINIMKIRYSIGRSRFKTGHVGVVIDTLNLFSGGIPSEFWLGYWLPWATFMQFSWVVPEKW
jgi:hypothetical protein